MAWQIRANSQPSSTRQWAQVQPQAQAQALFALRVIASAFSCLLHKWPVLFLPSFLLSLSLSLFLSSLSPLPLTHTLFLLPFPVTDLTVSWTHLVPPRHLFLPPPTGSLVPKQRHSILGPKELDMYFYSFQLKLSKDTEKNPFILLPLFLLMLMLLLSLFVLLILIPFFPSSLFASLAPSARLSLSLFLGYCVAPL